MFCIKQCITHIQFHRETVAVINCWICNTKSTDKTIPTWIIVKSNSYVFWVITRRTVLLYRRFGITYRPHFQGDRQAVPKRPYKTTVRRVMTKNTEEFISTAAKVLDHAWIVVTWHCKWSSWSLDTNDVRPKMSLASSDFPTATNTVAYTTRTA
jgi:hypothetical protein